MFLVLAQTIVVGNTYNRGTATPPLGIGVFQTLEEARAKCDRYMAIAGDFCQENDMIAIWILDSENNFKLAHREAFMHLDDTVTKGDLLFLGSNSP